MKSRHPNLTGACCDWTDDTDGVALLFGIATPKAYGAAIAERSSYNTPRILARRPALLDDWHVGESREHATEPRQITVHEQSRR